jgi:hypothetical protein
VKGNRVSGARASSRMWSSGRLAPQPAARTARGLAMLLTASAVVELLFPDLARLCVGEGAHEHTKATESHECFGRGGAAFP